MVSGKMIAVIDDDADDRFFVEDTFQLVGYRGPFRQFENGPQFMEFLHQTANVDLPTLIFLDLNMPVIEGKEILKELKRMDKWSHIPVIVFTTAISDIEKKLCMQMGASSYITKPTGLDAMKDLVKSISLLFSIPLQAAEAEYSKTNETSALYV
ncbi:MAG TPA: response regulator [Flavitalea sp.]|nr:response regulator [Flavitalea sp.]